MPIVGSFAGASSRAYGLQAGGAILSAFNSISTTTLSSNQSSIVLSSIPSTYKHLQIRGVARTTTASLNADELYLRMNADTGTNYSWHGANTNGEANIFISASTTQSYIRAGQGVRANNDASIFGVFIIDILDYADTNKFKTIRQFGGYLRNVDNANGTDLISGVWRSTNAITSLTISSASNNLDTNTSISLYGIAG